MRVYADTNFFTNVWATLIHSEEAQSLLTVLLNEREQLPVTWLVRVEFTNALQSPEVSGTGRASDELIRR